VRVTNGKLIRFKPMLAEKFFLLLEMLLSRRRIATGVYADGSPKIVSRAPFVPIGAAGSSL
jgi:hypothetical protein